MPKSNVPFVERFKKSKRGTLVVFGWLLTTTVFSFVQIFCLKDPMDAVVFVAVANYSLGAFTLVVLHFARRI